MVAVVCRSRAIAPLFWIQIFSLFYAVMFESEKILLGRNAMTKTKQMEGYLNNMNFDKVMAYFHQA